MCAYRFSQRRQILCHSRRVYVPPFPNGEIDSVEAHVRCSGRERVTLQKKQVLGKDRYFQRLEAFRGLHGAGGKHPAAEPSTIFGKSQQAVP